MIKFRPWVGDGYSSAPFGKRVLVLGESHYCANPEREAVPGITRSVIADLFDPDSVHEPYKNTYTKFIKALTGKFGELSVADKERAWNGVAFYNYVQVAMTGPRTAPTAEEFRMSDEAFWEVLRELRPEKVIAWGHRLYDELPDGGGRALEPVEGCDVWEYRLPFRKVEVLKMVHPSAGYSPEYWHGVIRKFIIT